MQVAPISSGAVSDSPTAGVFAGVTIGDWLVSVRPELGVFYDRSALKLRQSNFIIVPALTLQRRRKVANDDYQLKAQVLPTGGRSPVPNVDPIPRVGVPCRTPRCS